MDNEHIQSPKGATCESLGQRPKMKYRFYFERQRRDMRRVWKSCRMKCDAALSGLLKMYSLTPGRCPGLSHFAPLGPLMQNQGSVG